jgi:hypothetical protein
VTICPCCGFKFEGSLAQGCEACGARSVGEPLPKPDRELPSYGRSLLLTVTGALMVIVFLVQTVIEFVQRSTAKGFWASIANSDIRAWIAAAETAAWRLKWVAIPVTILVLWGTRKIYRSMLRSPESFCGFGYARAGFVTSAAVPLFIALLIGVTVPERLTQRRDANEAAEKALAYATDRILDQYEKTFGTKPPDTKALSRLPDPDGSIAILMKELETADYKPSVDLAAAPTKNPQPPRGAVIRNAAFSPSAEVPSESFSFTNYELRLPGPDKVLGNEDDLLVRDGVIISNDTKATKPIATSATATKATKR